MTDGIQFEHKGNIFTWKKTQGDKTAQVTMIDTDGDGLDNKDGVQFKGSTSIFTPEEIQKALGDNNYSDKDARTTKLANIPIGANSKITPKVDEKYDLGSFVTTLGPKAGTGAKPTLPPPMGYSASSGDITASASINVDTVGLQSFMNKWTNILSSMFSISTCDDNSLALLTMPELMKTMLADSDKLFSISNRTPATTTTTTTSAAQPKVETTKSKVGEKSSLGDTESTPAEKEVTHKFSKKKTHAKKATKITKSDKTSEPPVINAPEQHVAEVPKSVIKKSATSGDVTSELYKSLDNIHKWNYNASVKTQTKKINENNVIEVMRDWDKHYKTELSGTYGDSLIEAINNKRPLFNVQYQVDALGPIKRALIARAKKLGLESDAKAFDTIVQRKLSSPITFDYQVEGQFNKLRQLIEAKENQQKK